MAIADFEPSIASAIQGSFLSEVHEDLTAALIGGAHLREVPAGRVFLSVDQAHRCGLLVRGTARVYFLRTDGAQMTIRRAGAGATFGIRAIGRRHNRVNVQALTDVEFLQFDLERLTSLSRTHASLAWAVARELDRNLDSIHLYAESNVIGSVRQRAAALLLDIGVTDAPGSVDATQEQLAELTGSSREAIGRELRLMHAEGLISLRRTRVTVLDPLGLQAVASNRWALRLGTRRGAAN